MNIKKFVAFSVIIHISVLIGLYFAPEGVKKKSSEFITSLVSPEELSRPALRPLPLQPPVTKSRPFHTPIKPPAAIAKPRSIPVPDRPLVPGMGRETGKQLPKDVQPEAGKSERKGEGPDSRTRPGLSEGGQGEGRPGGTGKEVPSDKPGYQAGPKPNLYDPEEVDKISRKEMAGSQKKKDDSITFDTSDYRYAGYMRKLKEKIESIWVYPPEAAARGLVGDLKIRFTIRKDGTLASVELERTSGNKMLDDAAMKALKDGEPYWPIPDSWDMDSYTVPGHFIYTMYGYSLR